MVHSVFGGFSILQGEWLKTINAPLLSSDLKRTRNDRKKLIVSKELNFSVVEEELEATSEAGRLWFDLTAVHSAVLHHGGLCVKKTVTTRETWERSILVTKQKRKVSSKSFLLSTENSNLHSASLFERFLLDLKNGSTEVWSETGLTRNTNDDIIQVNLFPKLKPFLSKCYPTDSAFIPNFDQTRTFCSIQPRLWQPYFIS